MRTRSSITKLTNESSLKMLRLVLEIDRDGAMSLGLCFGRAGLTDAAKGGLVDPPALTGHHPGLA
jgi:hypothetical protein